MGKRVARVIFMGALMVLQSAMAQSQAKTKRHANMREALGAAMSTRDQASETEALEEVTQSEPTSREDVIALYDAIKTIGKSANVKGDRKAREKALKVGHPLQKCLDSKHHAVIAELLEKEARDLPRNLMPTIGHAGGAQDERATIRFAAVSTIIDIAGRSKNRQALPGLRKLVDKGGPAGNLASGALSQIGDPQDLENFIQRVKKDPKAQLNFSGFGVAGIERIMREVDQNKLSKEVSGALIVRIGGMDGPGATAALKGLLTHKDRRVVETASNALAQRMTKDDSQGIMSLIGSSDPEVRFQGLTALAEKAWSEDKAPIVIGLLKNDPDAGVRSLAAYTLGRRNVKSSAAALTSALNDESRRVQSAAEGALQLLAGH